MDVNDGRYDAGILTGRMGSETEMRINVVGGDWQKQEIANLLVPGKCLLTAIPKKTKDGSGELSLPLTWAIVTQLASLAERHEFKWRPEPDLNLWIAQEFQRRFAEYEAPGDLKFDLSTIDRTPMPHQLSGAYTGALNRRFFFGDAAGLGKTFTALLTLAELEAKGLSPWPVFVVAPASVCGTWREEIAKCFPQWTVAHYTGVNRRKLSTRYQVYVMSWHVFRQDMQPPELAECERCGYRIEWNRKLQKQLDEAHRGVKGSKMPRHEGCPKILPSKGYAVFRPIDSEKHVLPPLLDFLAPKAMIFDEAHALCLSHTSCITTPSGPKKISEVREGDSVLGVDHATGRDVWTRVSKVGRSPLRKTVKLGPLELTPDHPVWVSDSGCIGYASSHDEDFYLRQLREVIRSEALSESADTKVLQQGMHERSEVSGNENGSFPVGDPGASSSCPQEPGEVTYRASNARVPGFRQEPVQGRERRGNQGALDSSEQGCWVQGTDGRERGAYYPAGAVAEAARDGVHPRVLSRPGVEATGVPDVLQGGSWLPSAEAWSGAGREEPPFEVTTGAGQEEGREASVTWVDGTSVLEYGSPERSLWNLSTDTGNYVAAGILVHNCNATTKQSGAAGKIARVVDYIFLMSGTPITRDVTGFWRACTLLDIRSFPDQERYAFRYADRTPRDYGKPNVEGLTTVNRQEFYTMMQGTMRYVSKRDVLKDLPDKTYVTRAVNIPPAYRVAYDEMESDMLAHIPDTDEPLPVMSTLAQMQRLTQLASSACDVEIEMVLDEKEGSLTYGEMVPHYKVSMREPSWKVDELMAVMEESGGEPILCFAPHTQLVNLAGKRAEKAGYRVAYITGQVNTRNKDRARHAFQAGELDLLCANVTAGGVGLTLTRSHTAVFLERPAAFWQADQAEDRIHRTGQTEPVSIIDIVAVNTIESRVRELMKNKAGQLGDLVRDPRIVRSFLGGQKIYV
jgi:hypothetical protein